MASIRARLRMLQTMAAEEIIADIDDAAGNLTFTMTDEALCELNGHWARALRLLKQSKGSIT